MTHSQLRLSRRFYRRPADALARALVGKNLVHGNRSGIIVETEAYMGPEDLASHARFGITARNRVMFGPGGVSYVYLCYGIHDMFNIVSGRDGEPGAVLVRAVDVAVHADGEPADRSRASGPGKLTRALGLTREHNGIDLSTSEHLFITRGQRVAPDNIACGPRIGIDYAGAWKAAPLRFWLAGHPAVSRAPRRPKRKSKAVPSRKKPQ